MKIATLIVLGIVAVSVLTASATMPRHKQTQDQDDNSRRDIMRTKLMMSQNIVEGLMSQNFEQIAEAGKELVELTKAERWLVPKAPDYAKYSNQFRKSVEALISNANEKNLDASAMRYFDMMTECMDCHTYLTTEF